LYLGDESRSEREGGWVVRTQTLKTIKHFNIAVRKRAIRVSPALWRDSPNGPMARPRPLYWDLSQWRVAEPPRWGISGFPTL